MGWKQPKKYIEILTCALDGSTFKTHRQFLFHLKTHEMSEQTYYDKFLNNNDGKCGTCRKDVDFINILYGYKRFCSHDCAIHNEGISVIRNERTTIAVREMYQDKEKVEAILKKRRTTKLQRYGCETYTNYEKVKETTFRRYGGYYINTPEYKERLAKISREKYGVEHFTQNNDVKEKNKATCRERYGVEYALQVPEIRERITATCMEKYGGVGAASPIINPKIKKTLQENLGVTSPLHSSAVVKKVKDTVRHAHLPVIQTKLDKKNLSLVTDYTNSKDHLEFVCDTCNYIFIDTFSSGKTPECPKCNSHANTSLGEREVRDYIISLGVTIRERKKLAGTRYEVDLFLPDYNIAIEFDGLYWHSERVGMKDSKYHLMKTSLAESQNIILIHIFEDEWRYKQDIIKSKIKHLVNQADKKIFGRKTTIQPIDGKIAKEFLDVHHIQGHTPAVVNIGCYYESELVAVMTFGHLRKALGHTTKNTTHWELYRYATKQGYSVVGAFGKLLTWFKDVHNPEYILTYADRRFTTTLTKNIYDYNGFQKTSVTKPNYHYIKSQKRYHRYSYRKNVLEKKLSVFDQSKSEWENMKMNGFDRIWDCGHIKYEYKK